MDDTFIFLFVHHRNSRMKFFHYSVYYLFYTAVWMQYIYIYVFLFFFENFLWLFYMTYLTKVCKWTHFIQQNVFITYTALTPNTWLNTHITSSAHEMRIVFCDSPVNTDIIFSYTLRTQMLRTVLVFINRWQESICPVLLLNVLWPWCCSTVADGVWFEIRRMRKHRCRELKQFERISSLHISNFSRMA